MSCVRINNMLTENFHIKCSVKQGDPTSPTLFALYMNDLINDINDVNQGVQCGNQNISALCYADDIVILSESPNGLQRQLDIVDAWCKTWRMEINQDKTKVVHSHDHM